MSAIDFNRKHGTRVGYRTGCRCDACKDSNSARIRKYRQSAEKVLNEKKTETGSVDFNRDHGTRVGYRAGCRCDPCKDSVGKGTHEDKSTRKWTTEQLREAVTSSMSIAAVLRALGLLPSGGNYEYIKDQCKRAQLDTSHFTGQSWRRGSTIPSRKRSLEELLVDDLLTSSRNLRRRLTKEGLFEERCSKCLLTEWLGEPIPLELDHVNGNKRDNRLSNLRVLCPNCHAQTPTYRGRNKSTNGGKHTQRP